MKNVDPRRRAVPNRKRENHYPEDARRRIGYTPGSEPSRVENAELTSEISFLEGSIASRPRSDELKLSRCTRPVVEAENMLGRCRRSFSLIA